jgi:hypothetical protein
VSEASGARRFGAFVCHVALLALLLFPLLLVIFRLTIFDTLPRDDYSRILLWWLGAGADAAPPGSPYGYRVLSNLAGAPFYYLLPSFALTNLPAQLGAEYIRANAAMAAASFMGLIVSMALAYRLVVDRFGLGRSEGVFAGLVTFVMQLHAAIFSVDPLAICVVLLALYFLDRVAVFTSILIVSVIVNEKIAIVLAIWLTIRCVFGDRALLGRQWLASVAAVIVYAAMVVVVRLPGHGEQFDPAVYWPTVMQNLTASVTPRGLLFNILPCLLLVGAVVWSWRSRGWQRDHVYAPIDLLVVPALAVVALMLTQFFQVGRVVMHGAPLFMWPLVQQYASWVRHPGS